MIVLVRGAKTQTVNVCTAENTPGDYESVYRLPIDADIQPGDLSDIAGLDGLREFLIAHNGTPEIPGVGRSSAGLPELIPPDLDDPWLQEARDATERAINALIDEFREKPYLHRVEHSLHARLYGLLVREEVLRREVPLGTGQVTQLVHKEWPERAPRERGGSTRKRGLFDLAVLAPRQLARANLDQFLLGRISAPIVIEVGLDYPLGHLQQDIDKLKNSEVPCAYALHLTRVTFTDQRQVEDVLVQQYDDIRMGYVHWDRPSGITRYKHLQDNQIAPG